MWDKEYEIDEIIEVTYGYKKTFRYIFLSLNNSEPSLVVMQDAQNNEVYKPVESKNLTAFRTSISALNYKEVSKIAKTKH